MADPPTEFVALLRQFMDRAAALMDAEYNKRRLDAGHGERFKRMQEEHTLAARLSALRQRRYDALRARDVDLFRRCVQAAEAVTLNHRLAGNIAADIEWAVIGMVCDAIGVAPDKPEPLRSPVRHAEVAALTPAPEYQDARRRGPLSASIAASPVPIPALSGDACRTCGNFSLVRSGKCQTCMTCGATDGCS